MSLGMFGLAAALDCSGVDVPLVMQMPELPTGCEAVSAVMVLNGYGFSIGKQDFVESYLDMRPYRSESMYMEYFLGDPASFTGSYCDPPALADAVMRYSNAYGAGLSAHDMTGKSLDMVLETVSRGIPAALWVTIGYVEPDFRVNEFGKPEYSPTHCVVVTGYSKEFGVLYINDPLEGKIEKGYDIVKRVYDMSGRRSMYITRQ